MSEEKYRVQWKDLSGEKHYGESVDLDSAAQWAVRMDVKYPEISHSVVDDEGKVVDVSSIQDRATARINDILMSGIGDKVIAENLGKFKGLDEEVALKVLKEHQGTSITTEALEKLEGLDHKAIALKLLEKHSD
jgi:hypothetical protein